LAEVYVDLVGARQSQLILTQESQDIRIGTYGDTPRRLREIPLAPRVTDTEREAHRAFVATLGDKPIWNEYLPESVTPAA
jgi:DNA polymerase III subunit epsilon